MKGRRPGRYCLRQERWRKKQTHMGSQDRAKPALVELRTVPGKNVKLVSFPGKELSNDQTVLRDNNQDTFSWDSVCQVDGWSCWSWKSFPTWMTLCFLVIRLLFSDQIMVAGQKARAQYSKAWAELTFVQLVVKAKQKANQHFSGLFVKWKYFLCKMLDKEPSSKVSIDFSWISFWAEDATKPNVQSKTRSSVLPARGVIPCLEV